MRLACSSWVEWLILKRATFIPAFTISRRIFLSAQPGPIVAMILVFLVYDIQNSFFACIIIHATEIVNGLK